MERIAKKINAFYYLVYTATILSTVVGYTLTLNTDRAIAPQSPLGITLSSILIIYILISIPGSLAAFFRYTKKISKLEDKNIKLKKYENAAIARLLAVGSALVASVIIFFFLRNESIIYCAGISAIALFFCKPNVTKIANELDIEE